MQDNLMQLIISSFLNKFWYHLGMVLYKKKNEKKFFVHDPSLFYSYNGWGLWR